MYIREANRNDIKKLLDFFSKIYIYEQKINSEIITPSEEFLGKIESQISEQIQDNAYLFLVGEENGKSIGFLKGRLGDKPGIWSYNRFSYIEALFISEKYRKKGCAQKLCDAFFTWAKRNESDRVLLDVIHGNDNAMDLYQKLGFTTHTITLEKDL